MNTIDFSVEYSKRTKDELLHLASDRSCLTSEAAAALDNELRRRNLTKSEEVEHQRFVRHNAQREARKRRRRIFGAWKDRKSWADLLWALLATVLIFSAYLALPRRYHLRPDWQESAVHMMFASVFIGVAARSLWRRARFWTSLAISSVIHLVTVHSWIQRVGNLSHSQGELAILPGPILFFAVYACIWRLLRSNSGKETSDQK